MHPSASVGTAQPGVAEKASELLDLIKKHFNGDQALWENDEDKDLACVVVPFSNGEHHTKFLFYKFAISASVGAILYLAPNGEWVLSLYPGGGECGTKRLFTENEITELVFTFHAGLSNLVG